MSFLYFIKKTYHYTEFFFEEKKIYLFYVTQDRQRKVFEWIIFCYDEDERGDFLGDVSVDCGV